MSLQSVINGQKPRNSTIKGIVHNYSLQRWTDQDIVDYLREEKKIKIARSTVTTIKIRLQRKQEIGILNSVNPVTEPLHSIKNG